MNKIYYRNTQDIVIEGTMEEIDEGSLWELHNTTLVLVDQDRYIEVEFDASLFEKSE